MSARKLNEILTAEVVGRMHRYRISKKELAPECHFSLTYLSLVLNCVKEFSTERAKEKTKNHILKCLKAIEDRINREIQEEEKWYEYFNKTRDFYKKR